MPLETEEFLFLGPKELKEEIEKTFQVFGS